MKRPAWLFLVPGLLVAGVPRAQALPPDMRASMERLIGDAKTSSRAFETLRSLTDGVGPRLAGSPGDRAAVAWGLAKLTELGFSNVRAEKATVPHWERGVETGEMIAPHPHRFALCALGGSVPTPEGGLEADVVEAGSLEEVDALGDKAKGKIVFIWKTTRRAPDGGGYGETVPIRGQGASHAAKLGALGVLIRSVGTDTNRLPHTGAMNYAEGVSRIPAAALSVPDADLLHRLIGAGQNVRVRFTLTCRTLPDAESANVIGEIVGREKPEEIVLIGGHLDSWDLGTGAVDDGAGCAISIEAARLVAALPRRPRRTIRVVLFANEENGLGGGKAYAVAHAAELSKHVAAIEADAGAGRALGFGGTTGPGAEAALAEIGAVLAPIGAGESSNHGGGADLSVLKPAGVPLFSLRQDSSLYFDIHHTANDVLEKVSREDLDQAVAAEAALLYALAERVERFPRTVDAPR